MIITCEQCQARFRMADEKLKPGGTKVRCSKCKSVFTVMPPEPAPADEGVDYGDFNMERLPDEQPAPAPPAAPEPPSVSPEPPGPSAADQADLDFSTLEQTMGPGTGPADLAEEFSFADTSSPSPSDEDTGPTAADSFGEEPFGAAASGSGDLDFDATFAESEEPLAAAAAPGPAEFAFDQELAQGETGEAATLDFATGAETPQGAEFDFGTGPEPQPAGEFTFESGAGESGFGDFGFETSAAEEGTSFAQGEAPAEAAESFEFGDGESFESSATETGTAYSLESPGTSGADSFEFGSGDSFESSADTSDSPFGESWEQPGKDEGVSFDFDEPNFETSTGDQVAKGRDEAGLSFGEIDFSDQPGEAPPVFGSEPDFAQATLARPAETETPPPPPPQRPAAERPLSMDPPLATSLPRKSPMSRMLLLLVLLLVILCGAGGYFLFMGNGMEVIGGLMKKVKGEEPVAPVEQRIGLSITGSSYVNNREAGQLLVVQGTATNNFSTTRTAISVKGVLLDGAGKVLQQQTVFCGNHLDEGELQSMKYAQIEEAMNNQFGASLSNMNVSPGKALRFTIVFRNVPKEMANINVEVVDSKPGGV